MKMKKMTPCLWFNNQAEEAAQFYMTVFKNSKIGKTARYGESGASASGQKAGSVMTVEFDLLGMPFLGLNGGPEFNFSPSLSFFVSCESKEEIQEMWQKLSPGGKVRMGLDQYPWATQYGWTSDKFGVEWQLMQAPGEAKISPAFLYVDNLFGKGEEAINFYLSVFGHSKIQMIDKDAATASVRFCSFELEGQGFVLMEGQGKHGHEFTHATSLIVNCETQAEIDKFSDRLSEGGSLEPCGWVKDKYGVSWQITPTMMAELMASSDPAKSERIMKAMLQMKKLDIEKLKQAARG
jgi:predicted 3-demethylubiquinone-9 3-methyltransferase (glyoxalase superfamily)